LFLEAHPAGSTVVNPSLKRTWDHAALANKRNANATREVLTLKVRKFLSVKFGCIINSLSKKMETEAEAALNRM
jgi:hypothetical protein